MKTLPITAICFASLIGPMGMAQDSGSASADQVLANAGAVMKSMKSYQFDAVAVRTFPASSSHPAMTVTEKLNLKFMRPNFFDVTVQESNQRPGRELSDGTSLYQVFNGIFYKSAMDPEAADFEWFHNDLLLYLFKGSFADAVEAPFPPVAKLLADEDVDGQSCRVVDAKVPGGLPIDYKIYVGDDGVPKKIIHTETGDRPLTIEFSLSNFKADPDLSASDFQFHPDPSIKAAPPVQLRPGEVPLIAVGAKAPEFKLPTPGGPRLALSQALAGKRALLLNFWFVHCPPCRAEHPKLQKFYDELKGSGFGLLTIDDQDTGNEVAKYLKGAGLNFPTVLSGPMAATDPKTGRVNYAGPKLPDYASLTPFGVHWCPTNILLDSQGRVIYVSDRWDEAGLRKALATVGVH